MIHIAITGGIACGKSLVGQYLETLGFSVVDTDILAKQVLCKNSDGTSEVIKIFGDCVVDPSTGELDRRKLSEVVFSDPEKLKQLEDIVHPRVGKLLNEAVKQADCNHLHSVVMIPLLFEAGFDVGWDSIICISSFIDIQLKRLEERNIPKDMGLKIIRSQQDDYSKRRRSDFVILNNGTKNSLKKQIDLVLNNIMEKNNGKETRY